MASPDACQLCERELKLTFHHLVPRTLHSNKWFKTRFTAEELRAGLYLCRPCHSAIHRFIDEKTLGRDYHTRDALLAHPDVAKFVAWVRTQRKVRIRTR